MLNNNAGPVTLNNAGLTRDTGRSPKGAKSYASYVAQTNKSIILIETALLKPSPWNKFKKWSKSKMLEVKYSILANKLFYPIIVWEQLDGTYMILSGHNRVDAYKEIYEEYKDEPGFNADEYLSIPAIVYSFTEINESKAREMIVDTNYLQRDEREMKEQTAYIIQERLEIVKNRTDIKGRKIEYVAEMLGMKRTKVYEDSILVNKVIPEARELYFNGTLSKKPILRFAWFSEDIQKWIITKYLNILTDKKLMQLKKGMKEEEIAEILEQNVIKVTRKTISIRVPDIIENEAKEFFKAWIAKREEELISEGKIVSPGETEEEVATTVDE